MKINRISKENWLQEGPQTKITDNIVQIVNEIPGEKLAYVSNALEWMKANLKSIAGKPGWKDKFRTRTADEILTEKTTSGCGDIAVAFIALTRGKGIPSILLEMPFKSWLESDDIGSFSNHDIAKVFVNGKWYWVDPTKGIIGNDISVAGNHDYVILAEALDSWEMGINSWESYKERYLEFRKKYIFDKTKNLGIEVEYPKTERVDKSEVIFGHKIVDPYRWLEDGESSRVREWTKEQNKFCEKIINERADVKDYRKHLKKVYDVTSFGLPRKAGDYYFWNEKQGNENQAVLYCKKGLNGKGRTLVNPNTLDKNGLSSLDSWNISKSGRYVAYGISKAGSEDSTLYVLDVRKKVQLKEEIPHTRYPNVRWLPDESGFYYTRFPAIGEVPKGEELYHQRIYFHKLGESYKKDDVIFGERRYL